MPECLNCERFVTRDYVRVFSPREMDTVRCCPKCEDKIRTNGEVREARSTRYQRESEEDDREMQEAAPDGGRDE